MHSYLRGYCDLKTYRVIGAAGRAETLDGLLFDNTEWSVRGLCVDVNRPLIVDVAAIEQLVDAPPQLLVRAGGDREAAARRSGAHYRYLDDLLEREVVARDGIAGRIDDVLVNTRHWALRYYVVRRGDTRTLLHVRWTSDIDDGPGVHVAALPAEAIETAPAYHGLSTLTPGHQDCLYRHYTSREFA